MQTILELLLDPETNKTLIISHNPPSNKHIYCTWLSNHFSAITISTQQQSSHIMDAKQLRVRFFSAEENKEETSQRIPTQKTRSFKGEKRKGQNWLRRQLSREMSRDYDDTDGEYSAAVAAATFAINSLEESRLQAQSEKNQASITNINKKTDDKTIVIPKPPALPNKHSDDVTDERPKEVSVPAKFFKRNATSDDKRPKTTGSDDVTGKRPKEATVPAASFKRTLTSDDKRPNTTGSTSSTPDVKKASTFADTNLKTPATTTKPENVVPKSNIPPTKQSVVEPSSIKPVTKNSTAKADMWEKAEMMKIKERYDRVCATILEWENSKKKKAERQAQRKEDDSDWKRAKAMQRFRNKIVNIEAIAGGARAQAEENRRNAELKVKEKADKIRATGEIPKTCFCF